MGYYDALSGVIGGQHFHIHGMKDPDKTMVLMIIYGILERSENEKNRRAIVDMIQFNCPDIVINQYTYRHRRDLPVLHYHKIMVICPSLFWW